MAGGNELVDVFESSSYIAFSKVHRQINATKTKVADAFTAPTMVFADLVMIEQSLYWADAPIVVQSHDCFRPKPSSNSRQINGQSHEIVTVNIVGPELGT